MKLLQPTNTDDMAKRSRYIHSPPERPGDDLFADVLARMLDVRMLEVEELAAEEPKPKDERTATEAVSLPRPKR
jgi:hypothetical protein